MRQILPTSSALERNSREIRELVGILTRSRDRHSATPVEVHVAQFVREALHLVRIKALSVVQDVVRCRGNGALAAVL